MAAKVLPSRALVYEFLSYDPEALHDAFIWNHRDRKHFPTAQSCRTWNTSFAHHPAGRRALNGYHVIAIFGYPYLAHRLAWLLIYGEPVPRGLDHINGDKLDNRIKNLRAATTAENAANMRITTRNKTNIKGVYYAKQEKKFCAQICKNGKRINLGYFNSIEDAAAARREAAIRLHGKFAHHG